MNMDSGVKDWDTRDKHAGHTHSAEHTVVAD